MRKVPGRRRLPGLDDLGGGLLEPERGSIVINGVDEVRSDGAQSCTQTVQVGLSKVDGEWKIDELTLLTTS
jgi:hypothetical protein